MKRILGVTCDSKIAIGTFSKNHLVEIYVFESFPEYLMKNNKPSFVFAGSREQYVSENTSVVIKVGQKFESEELEAMMFRRAYGYNIRDVDDNITKNVLFCFKCTFGFDELSIGGKFIRACSDRTCDECAIDLFFDKKVELMKKLASGDK